MQINNYKSNQNFGMAIHSNINVNQALKARVKTAEGIKRLDKAIELANRQHEVNINLLIQPDGRSISANVFTDKPDLKDQLFSRSYSENMFTKLFEGPVGFIERVVNIADKKAKQLIQEGQLNHNNVLGKML